MPCRVIVQIKKKCALKKKNNNNNIRHTILQELLKSLCGNSLQY